MKNILFQLCFCATLCGSLNAQYLETFSTVNKGYKVNCVNDFTGVNWSMSPWNTAGMCQSSDIRDPADYFNTTTAGVLESIDLDEEICWESPLMNISTAGTVSISVGLSWDGFDADNAAGNCAGDYIRVMYSVNGGSYTMVPNQFGGNPCATIAYLFGAPGAPFKSSGTATKGGISGNTLKIKVCIFTNANAEIVKIDNVNVPQAGVSLGCPPPVLSTLVTHVGCSNPNSGAVDLSVSAGTPGYTYAWSNGATTQDITSKPVGTYTVTVTDVATCSATTIATISNAPALVLSTQVLNASCNGNADGGIDLGVTGGVPGYTYDWSNDGTENPDNDTQDLSGLPVGTYTVTVTDASSCSDTTSVTITQPAGLLLTSTIVNPSNCFVADGSIDLSVSNGVAPFNYDWSNDGSENPDNDPQDLTNLDEGSYTVTVTDANGCTASHNKTLDYIDIINPSINCPGNANRNVNEGICKYTINLIEFNATALDNCGINAPHVYTLSGVTIGTNSGSLNGVMLNAGITTIQWKVTDVSGNTNTCSFMVNVLDTQVPTITCPSNKSVITTPCQNTVNVALGSPTGVGDNCGAPVVTNNSPGTFQLGVTIVTWTATDASANTKTCTQSVTVMPYQCANPIQVYHTDTTATTAKVKWKIGKCATSYQLRIRKEITYGVWDVWSSWVTSSSALEHLYTGLTANKFYNYQIRTICGTTNSASINDWFYTLPSLVQIDNRLANETNAISETAEIENQINLFLIPNPARDFTTVRIEGFEQHEKTVTMLDLYGKLVFNVKINSKQNQLELDLNTLGVHTGIYLIRISNEFKQKTEQLMIER